MTASTLTQAASVSQSTVMFQKQQDTPPATTTPVAHAPHLSQQHTDISQRCGATPQHLALDKLATPPSAASGVATIEATEVAASYK